MRKTLVVIVSILGVVLITATILDQTRTFCVTQHCKVAVDIETEERRKQQVARAAENARISQIERSLAVVGRINATLNPLRDKRRQVMSALNASAQSAANELQARAQADQMRLIELEPIFAGSGGTGFLAREDGKEKIRAMQVAVLGEQKKMLALESDVFFQVPDPIKCGNPTADCSGAIDAAIAEWEQNIEQSNAISMSAGLEGAEELNGLVSAYRTAIAGVKRPKEKSKGSGSESRISATR